MNCQLRLGVTWLYMTGQIHSRLPARWWGGVGDNETRMYELPAFGLISQTGKVKPSCAHLTSDKRGWHPVGRAFLDLHVKNEQLFW